MQPERDHQPTIFHLAVVEQPQVEEQLRYRLSFQKFA